MKLASTSSGALVLALAALQLATDLPGASAKRQYISRIPNGANVPGVQAIGHSDSTGDSGSLDAFGSDFGRAGDKWTVALCQKDLDGDGDGHTNGQELGDPCCTWTSSSGSAPQWTTGVSDPGDKSATSDASLWASANCSTTATAGTTTTTSAAHDNAHSAAVAKALIAAAVLAAALC